jgi:predicted ATPase/signal transduction histidine kinase
MESEQREATPRVAQEPGYALEPLTSRGEFTLYRGRRGSEPAVLALAINPGRVSPQNVERLTQEQALAAELDPAWAVRPLALARHEGRPMLVLEAGGAEPLDLALGRERDNRLELSRFFRIADELARALAQMHRHGLVHKDIKPANVLVDDADRVRLTGFGIATRLRRERQSLAPPKIVAGTVAYMAPEQTGRMNRSLDARSDLYSFGVTLYELLTGGLPFTASGSSEWIHCHVARQPPPPSARVYGLSAALDAIILKLLAKSPDDRYQTAAGVASDLRRCEAWIAQGRKGTFALGEHDVPDRLLIPERLYGRDGSLDVLRAAFERVTNGGRSELVLISGHAGMGKSSISNELQRSLVVSGASFASGKFDQYKRDVPYAPFAQALQDLVRQRLDKGDAELQTFRGEVSRALGSNGQLMVNLIPELALVIGEQPPIPRVEPHDAAARFHLVFKSLLGVFARARHPLVLFVDDLQWLDAGTLDLLQRLVSDPESRHVLLIAAYRENEVGPSHPLASTLGAIRSAGAGVTEILLAPLKVDEISRLLADALRADPERTAPLAELVHEKTAGNPFFTIQFIAALGEEGLLALDPRSSCWHWDVERIRAKAITQNVADLLATKLGRLPPTTREALGQLACLGNSADVGTLALIASSSEEHTLAALKDAAEAGLIVRGDGSVAFIHDTVHEAAYALTPSAQRAAAHLRIGRALLGRTSPAELGEQVFEIANQFDRGVSAIDSLAERELVAELNLVAGKRAKMSSAHASALAYFTAGRALLDEVSWQQRYRLLFELELNRAECEIVAGELALAEQRLNELSARAQGLGDRADVVCLAVLLYFTTGRSDRAVQVALELLTQAGIDWSPSPTEAEVRREYERMRENLARRPLDTLTELPPMVEPSVIAVMAVLTELFPAAYAVDRYLMELVLLRMTNLSLEHGNCESSSVAYSAANMALGVHFGDYATAHGLGKIARALVDRRAADRYTSRVYSCVAAFAMPWLEHVSRCEPLMRHAFRAGIATGDTAFATYDLRNLLTHLLVAGTPLAQVQREAEQALAFASKVALGMPSEWFFRQLELVQRLRGVAIDHPLADDSWARQPVEHLPGLAMMVCYHWVFYIQERYLARSFAAALEAAARVEGIRWAMRSSIEEAEYDFYAGLAHAGACDCASPQARAEHVSALARHEQRLAAWAANCPDNFASRRTLLAAEFARVGGQELEAQRLYERALRLAREQGFVQVEALANELAGEFHATRELETIAESYLRNARDGYERWGALVKVRQLDLRYVHLRAQALPSSLMATIEKPTLQLDVETVDRASQTLSSEIVLPSLLEKLMRLSLEHAGAERGLMILLHGDEPHIEAEATTNGGRLEVVLRREPVTARDLPPSALQYVLRTQGRLVLDDALAEGLDPRDEYVARARPRSVLCLPIFKLTKVIGALYLENNLTTRAFMADRVRVLDFLASQAAIALENARLYSELQRSEALLKQAQHLSSTGSFYWRASLDTIEFSEQTYRMYGLDAGAPVTLDRILALAHPEDRSLLQEMIERARGLGSDLDYQYRVQLPSLALKYFHLVAHGTRGKDGELEYIGAIQDVTQRRRSEEALGKVRSELAHVARVTSLGVLTASIAHEVNQPLAAIVTNASTCLRLLATEPPNLEGARDKARRMIKDGHRAADVVARLRALFTGKEAATETVDLNEATREVIALSASELQKNRVALHQELALDLPAVTGDRVQLQQVILNLLLNATDALRSVEARPRQIVIRTARAEDGVRLSVKDSGVGIAPQAMTQLFEAFYSTKPGGMGIGLSVSRSIIESHQGRIWAESNDDHGATFAFSLPCPVPSSAQGGA